MNDSGDNAGPGPSQHTDNAKAEPVRTSNSNVGNATLAVEDREKASLRKALMFLGVSEEATFRERPNPSLGGALQAYNSAGDTVHHLIASKEIHGDVSSKSFKQKQAKEAVEDILSVCPDVLVSRDGEDNTPLHRACLVDNSFVVEALLRAEQQLKLDTSSGSISNLKNKAGDIPLHLAVRKGHLETVKKLMADDQSHGTTLAKNKQKQTPMHVSADQGRAKIFEELLKDMTLQIDAARDAGDKATSKNPLDEEEKTNGWTALHFASRRGDERIVELLLLNGADSKKTDKHGLLAADVARRANHVDIADFIRQYRPRSFRLELEPGDANTVKVNDHFLVLSWPKWDKTVRHHQGELPRMWPHLTPVHQFIFNATDYYYKSDPEPRSTRWIHFPANDVSTKIITRSRLSCTDRFDVQRAWIEVCIVERT